MKNSRVNLYTPDLVRLWLRLMPSGGLDLELEQVEADACGEEPEWLSFELSNLGWDGIFYDWVRHPRSWATFALEGGIAPRQPFQIEICRPRYIRHDSVDGYEWDVEWDAVVVRTAHLSEKSAAKRWTELLGEVAPL